MNGTAIGRFHQQVGKGEHVAQLGGRALHAAFDFPALGYQKGESRYSLAR